MIIYCYARMHQDDNIFLGPIVRPEFLTLDVLDKMHEGLLLSVMIIQQFILQYNWLLHNDHSVIQNVYVDLPAMISVFKTISVALLTERLHG